MAMPPDPELKPVAAAQAELDRMAAEEPRTTQRVKERPAIRPADPGSWSTSVDLLDPLVVDDEPLTRLTIRKLTGGDVTRLLIEDDDATSINLRVRALMCSVHPDVIEALSADDALAVSEACRPFLPRVVADLESGLATALAEDVADARAEA